MYTRQVHDIHPIDRSKLGGMVALEDLLGEGDHFGVGEVETVGDALEKDVYDVVVDH